MNRRHWVLAGAGMAAVLAGVAWRERQGGSNTLAGAPATRAPSSAADPSASGVATSADGSALWDLSFETPAATPLAMSGLRGRPLLLNFWATWCPPCVKEFPMLDAFAREHAGRWQVVGLAIDRLDAVRGFLERVPVSFPVALAGIPGAELMRELGNTTGGLPFSLVFDVEGRIRERKLGELKPEDLTAWGHSFT